MSDEMLMESVPFESDESEDSESDESFIEASDSDEDYGEARSSRAARRARRLNRYLPVRRGVNGMRVRGPDGQVRNLPFPTKLATAAETNSGLASLEVGRRALATRVDKLEDGLRMAPKKDGTASGAVYLAIGGGLTAWSLFQTSKGDQTKPFFKRYSEQETAKMATLASATQLATSGAKWLTNGRYHRSGVGMTADAVSVLQILAFTYGSLSEELARDKIDQSFKDEPARLDAVKTRKVTAGEIIVQENTGEQFIVRAMSGPNGGLVAVRI